MSKKSALPASNSVAKAVGLHLEGKRQEAHDELKRATDAGEETPEVFSARGHLEYELERYADAVKSYTRLLELVPNHPTADFNLAICQEKLSKWQEAADHFERALPRDPERMETRLGLGICLLHLEKPEAALAHFEKVLSRDEKHETASFGKAVAY